MKLNLPVLHWKNLTNNKGQPYSLYWLDYSSKESES